MDNNPKNFYSLKLTLAVPTKDESITMFSKMIKRAASENRVSASLLTQRVTAKTQLLRATKPVQGYAAAQAKLQLSNKIDQKKSSNITAGTVQSRATVSSFNNEEKADPENNSQSGVTFTKILAGLAVSGFVMTILDNKHIPLEGDIKMLPTSEVLQSKIKDVKSFKLMFGTVHQRGRYELLDRLGGEHLRSVVKNVSDLIAILPVAVPVGREDFDWHVCYDYDWEFLFNKLGKGYLREIIKDSSDLCRLQFAIMRQVSREKSNYKHGGGPYPSYRANKELLGILGAEYVESISFFSKNIKPFFLANTKPRDELAQTSADNLAEYSNKINPILGSPI